MKTRLLFAAFVLVLVLPMLAACELPQNSAYPTQDPSSAPSITPTPDVCAPENISAEVDRINDLMREFDDISYVANMTAQSQLGDMILNLLTVRRELEDVDSPECTRDLRNIGIQYMNSVVEYLGNFMSGADVNTITTAVSASQTYRSYYESEFSRLMITSAIAMGTQIIIPTAATPQVIPLATNGSTQSVNLRMGPSLESTAANYLMPGESAEIIERNEAGDWLHVRYNDVEYWVYTRLVEINVPIEAVPMMQLTPTPSVTAVTLTPSATP